jgi:hypothetical protein
MWKERKMGKAKEEEILVDYAAGGIHRNRKRPLL